MDMLETGGARSFHPKEKGPVHLREKIQDAVRHYWANHRILSPKEHSPSAAEVEIRSLGLLGCSKVMLEIVQKIRKFRDKPYPVLLIGPTGSGKDYVAHALTPKGKKLITINCGRFAQSEHLLESELFGHIKGAFTGATHDQPGILAQAHEQVLFFDELHKLTCFAQAKILRFLETMKYRRLGDNSGPEITARVRLIAAVQPDIFDRIEHGEFLPDILGRVGDLRIQIPALVDRPEDIEPIVRYFQDEYNASVPPVERKLFRISTVHEMKNHPWPCNIRDIRSAVRTRKD